MTCAVGGAVPGQGNLATSKRSFEVDMIGRLKLAWCYLLDGSAGATCLRGTQRPQGEKEPKREPTREEPQDAACGEPEVQCLAGRMEQAVQREEKKHLDRDTNANGASHRNPEI